MPDNGREILAGLGRNEFKAVYRETEGEVIVSRIRDLLAAQRQDQEAHQRNVLGGIDSIQLTTNYDKALAALRVWLKTKKNSAYNKVFATDGTIKMLMQLLQLGRHFRHSQFIKVGWLNSHMANIHGGVTAYSISHVTIMFSDAYLFFSFLQQSLMPNFHYSAGFPRRIHFQL